MAEKKKKHLQLFHLTFPLAKLNTSEIIQVQKEKVSLMAQSDT